MANERSWERQGPVAFTADGGQDGLITVDNVACFKVKQNVVLSSSTLPDLPLQIKKVISLTQILVGPNLSKSENQTKAPQNQNNMKIRADISAYTVADGASVRAPEQSKSVPKVEDIWKAVYEQEPTVALRSFLVDKIGNGYTTGNPLPVQLSNGSINVDTMNADLSVQLTHFIKPDGTPADSVQIGDGSHVWDILPDGSGKVTIVSTPDPLASTKTIFDEDAAVASATATIITTYTAPVGKVSFLQRVMASGENIAEYEVTVNGAVVARKRSYFTEYNADFEFLSGPGGYGRNLAVGDVVRLVATHNRTASACFDSTIQVLEIG